MKGQKLGELEELVLLAIRAAGSEAVVVDVQEILVENTGRLVTLGAIYASLERLEGKGFAISTFGSPEAKRGGKRKRFYRVTPQAEKALTESRDARQRLWEAGRAELLP